MRSNMLYADVEARSPLAAGKLEKQAAAVGDEASRAQSGADTLHAMLDELETRLFGPEPRGVLTPSTGEIGNARPALAHTIKATRQRLDSAQDRLGRILTRL